MTKSLLKMTVSGGGAGTGVKELDLGKLNKFAMAIEEIADDDQISFAALRELADDNGDDVSHYVAAVALCTELRWQNPQPIVARVCVGNCQKYGAIGVIDKVAAELGRNEALSQRAVVIGATCLNQCERGPAVEVGSSDGKVLLAPATVDTVVAALREM